MEGYGNRHETIIFKISKNQTTQDLPTAYPNKELSQFLSERLIAGACVREPDICNLPLAVPEASGPAGLPFTLRFGPDLTSGLDEGFCCS